MTPSPQLFDGAFARTRDGRVFGPLRAGDHHAGYPFTFELDDAILAWTADGSWFHDGHADALDIMVIAPTPAGLMEAA